MRFGEITPCNKIDKPQSFEKGYDVRTIAAYIKTKVYFFTSEIRFHDMIDIL